MKHSIDALILCVCGCLFITCITQGPFKDKEVSVAKRTIVQATEAPIVPVPLEKEIGSISTPVTETVSASVDDPAAVCARFDPVTYPEQTSDILDYASKVTGTPYDVLYVLWRKETSVVYGSAGNDVCSVEQQLDIRCKVGGSCTHINAMPELVKRFNWNAATMQCSCGTSTYGNPTGNYGGCCGPFNFSAGEIKKDALELNVDPMTFCGGAIIMGREMMRYYKQLGSWSAAISRHYGNDDGHYYAGAYLFWKGISAVIDDPERLRAFITNIAKATMARSRDNLRTTPNNTQLASNN